MATLGELTVELLFEGNTKKAEEFKQKLLQVSKAEKQQKEGFKQTTKAIAGYVAAITGAIYAVQKLTDSLIKDNQQWLNLTRTSDMALSTFQKWNAVGKMYGINNAADQIKNLNDRLFELRLTGQGAKGFMLGGIRPTNAEDVMEQLRNRVSGMSDTAASYLLKQMGLDPNMLHILRLSRKEFYALNAEVRRFQLTDEQRKNIQKMNIQLQIANQKLQYLKDRAIMAILPYWLEFVQLIEKSARFIIKLTKNSKPLIDVIKRLAITLLLFSTKFVPLSKILASIPGILSQIISKLPLIRGFLLRIGATLMRTFLPLTAIYLLVDDIMGYFEGKNSVLGYIINAMKEFREKGIFSDDVPKWVQLLAKAADQLYEILYGKNDTSGMEKDRGKRTVDYDVKLLKELEQSVKDPKRLAAIKTALELAKRSTDSATTYDQEKAFDILDRYQNTLQNIQRDINNKTIINQINNNSIMTNRSLDDLSRELYLPYVNNAQTGAVY